MVESPRYPSPRGELAPGDFGRVFIGETLGERAASTAAANLFFSLVDAGGPFSGVGGVSGRGVEHVLGLSDNVGGVQCTPGIVVGKLTRDRGLLHGGVPHLELFDLEPVMVRGELGKDRDGMRIVC
jgi:hypothetical protein